MSKDRPGIVADIAGAIYDLKGDLADLNQSVLCGYFTMILAASFEEKTTAEDVVAKFSHIKSDTKLEVIVKEVEEEIEVSKTSLPESTYVLTAQGKNKSGLVAKMGEFCRSSNINILDLDTTLGDDVYTMILQVDLTNVTSVDSVRHELDAFGKETELKVLMHHNDIFKVTNEVTLF